MASNSPVTKTPFGIACLLLANSSFAQPVPKISSLSHDWFQRGTTNEIAIVGENLSGAAAVHVSGDPGVQATLVPADLGKTPVTLETSQGGIVVGDLSDPKKVAVRIACAPDASLNGREIRVITGGGVSNPIGFNLSALPEILESRTGSEAQKIAIPAGISGTISAAGEQDSYRFKAEKEQELILEVIAFRTGSLLDSSLVILDAAGKELARSEDAKGFDSFLRFRVPETGEYVAQLRDFRYGGSAKHTYHLTIGELSYIESAFPSGARRGQQVEVVLGGANLASLNKITLQPNVDAPVGWQEIRVHTPYGISTPFPFQVGDLAESVESEPNNATNQANAIKVPSLVNGRIGQAKDIDTFKFKVEQAQTLIMEVTAQRFGSPLDALLTLRDANGTVLKQNDDSEGADARIEFAFKKDQECTLSIRDLLERGGGNFVYRLSIRPPEPDFAVRFYPDNPRIHCGGRTVLRCELTRKAGFSGPVRLGATNLPPGVTCESVLINGDDPAAALLVLNASNSARGGVHPIQVVGTATINGTPVSRAAEGISGESPVKEGLLAVLDTPAPFLIELYTLALTLEQEQSADLDIGIVRRNGFEGEIKLSAEGYSAGREPLTQNLEAPTAALKPGQSHATLRLKAKPDAEIGSRLIYVRGETTVDGQPVIEFSQPIPLAVRQIPFTLRNTMKRLSVAVLPPGVQSAASEAEFAVRASRRGWFTDQINLSLEGLPEGVTATSTNLPNKVGEVTFKLTATEKAPVSKDFQITVLGSSSVAGRTYQQRTEPMTLSITKSQDVADTK